MLCWTELQNTDSDFSYYICRSHKGLQKNFEGGNFFYYTDWTPLLVKINTLCQAPRAILSPSSSQSRDLFCIDMLCSALLLEQQQQQNGLKHVCEFCLIRVPKLMFNQWECKIRVKRNTRYWVVLRSPQKKIKTSFLFTGGCILKRREEKRGRNGRNKKKNIRKRRNRKTERQEGKAK